MVLAVAEKMHGARHQFLANPRFSLDQYGNIRFGGPFGEPNDPRHILGPRHDVFERQFAGAAPRRAAQFVFERIYAYIDELAGEKGENVA